MVDKKTNMTGKSMSDNEVSAKRVNVLEDLVNQLVGKVKVIEDILMKKEMDVKDINHKIYETLPKHRTFCSKDMLVKRSNANFVTKLFI